jgi:hypothetical protein
LQRLREAKNERQKITVAELVLAGASRFSGEAIAEELMDLHEVGSVMWSEPDLSPSVEVVLSRDER